MSIAPLTATAPVAEEDFEECSDNDVCFTVLLEGEATTSPSPLGGGLDTWLYVTNPSVDIERAVAFGGSGEDNVVAESLTIRVTAPDGAESEFVSTPEEGFFADRWDPVVRASETRRVFFVGFNPGFNPENPLGNYQFEYELALTFRGESFTLTVDFEIELVSAS